MKNLKLFVAFAIMFCVLVSCKNEPKVDDGVESARGRNVTVYVDPETGVNYLQFTYGMYAGFVTARYNADGSLMVTK